MTATITPNPHIHTTDKVSRTMQYVLLALAPAAFLGVYYFGFQALFVIVISIASAVFFEAAFQFLTKKRVTIHDCSAVITGLLLAMTLPPNIPLWLPIVGSFVAIIFAKHLFGGLGRNFLNPALAGRAFLTLMFMPYMALGFVQPMTDISTGATPLMALSMGAVPITADYTAAMLGNISGSIGETGAIALLIGGLFLMKSKIITWHIPASLIGTVFVLMMFIQAEVAFYHVLLGGLILGAFFMATDYPTSPVAPIGKIIFGIGCGVFTVLFRVISNFPEGVMYAILIMNLAVPLIDRFIRPRVYGTNLKGV